MCVGGGGGGGGGGEGGERERTACNESGEERVLV